MGSLYFYISPAGLSTSLVYTRSLAFSERLLYSQDMEKKSRKKTRAELELNQSQVTLAMFRDDYNQNIPAGFRPVSVTVLKKFQEAHPKMFKQKDMWSVARHRKRLMDWLSSNSDIA